MNSAKTEAMDCRALEAKLPALLADLMFDPAAMPSAATRHLAACSPCQALVAREMDAHRATMAALDSWEAPEVTPYFDSRMGALLREEHARARAGLLERARNWFLVSNLHFKPLVGGAALATLLAIGGGTYLDLSYQRAAPAPQASATVRDLQSLDENAQVFQQMTSMDAGDPDSASSSNL